MYSLPKDFTWDELMVVLSSFGYEEIKKGKTGGSRRRFKDANNNLILLHEPHPGKIIKPTALKLVVEHLMKQENNAKK